MLCVCVCVCVCVCEGEKVVNTFFGWSCDAVFYHTIFTVVLRQSGFYNISDRKFLKR